MELMERFEGELPADLASFVRAQIGGEASTPDQLGEYMCALVRREQAQAQGYADTIRQQIDEGVASLRAGRTIDGKRHMAERIARLRELESQGR